MPDPRSSTSRPTTMAKTSKRSSSVARETEHGRGTSLPGTRKAEQAARSGRPGAVRKRAKASKASKASKAAPVVPDPRAAKAVRKLRGKLVVGIDLGGTNMQFGLVGPDNKILARDGKKTKVDEGTPAIIARLVDGVKSVCAQAGVKPSKLSGVGIGAPGAIEPDTGIVLEAPNLRWNNFPLASVLRQKLGTRVVVDNDVNAAVYGEWKLGAGRGATDFMGVWLGTGVGGGLVLNNRLYAGGFFTAGEIGHMLLVSDAPLGRRSVEQNCSRTAVVDRLISLIRSNHRSILTEMTDGDLTQIRSKLIAQAYEQQDRLTVRVLDECAEMIGEHIGSCVTLLSLQRIIMGGGLSEAMGENWVRLVRKAVRAAAFPARCKEVEVVVSELLDDAGLLGAALLAREKLR